MGTERRMRNCSIPGVEGLESKELLSTVTLTSHPSFAAIAPVSLPFPPIVGVQGVTKGSFTTSRSNPDIGGTTFILTTGRIQGLGIATVYGTLHSPGFIANGQTTGTLYVILPGGTLTLKVTGPVQSGPAGVPSELSFTIVKGTGKFHSPIGDPIGKGTIDVVLKPKVSGLTVQHGTATLSFHASIVAVA